MGWMFVPLTQYHGGGDAATIEPLKDHLAHYETRLANLLGAGVQACYRGPRLFDTDETWLLDFSQGNRPRITRFEGIGRQPYDALLTPEGRYYIAGLFGEDGMAKIDLWHPERGVERILDGTLNIEQAVCGRPCRTSTSSRRRRG